MLRILLNSSVFMDFSFIFSLSTTYSHCSQLSLSNIAWRAAAIHSPHSLPYIIKQTILLEVMGGYGAPPLLISEPAERCRAQPCDQFFPVPMEGVRGWGYIEKAASPLLYFL
jgi:hypothetical protein